MKKLITLLIISCIINSSHSQSLATGSTTYGTKLIEINNNSNINISKLVGKRKLNFKFIELDGQNNSVKLDWLSIKNHLTKLPKQK